MSGKYVIISAPSGSGKTTLVKHLLAQEPSLRFSISASSRTKREEEVDGSDYHFMSPETFRQKIEAGEFLEWEEVYEDQYYGTLKTEVERIWSEGKSVIFDVDVKGGLNLKTTLGEKALAIFIKVPSMEAIETRLRSRGTETDASMAQRLAKVEEEMNFENRFDQTVVNDDLEQARKDLMVLVQNFLAE